MFSDCCETETTKGDRYRDTLKVKGQLKRQKLNQNTCQDAQSSQHEGLFTKTPFKIKLLNAIGLRQFMIDKLVFARPQLTYKLQTYDNQKSFTFKTIKPNPIPGYQQIHHVIDLQNHFIPVIHFKRLSLTNETINDYEQLKLIQSGLTMIYSHGNSSNLELCYQIAELMIKKYPINYIVYDYTGYGYGCAQRKKLKEKQHNLSDASICSDLIQVIKWSKIQPQKLILWGYSLGCHPSIYASTKLKLNSLIIQSPFSSIYNMIQQAQLQQKPYKDDIFNNISLISQIQCDCLLIHSQDDDLIPIQHSKMLVEKFNQSQNENQIKFIEIYNIKHNEMPIVFCVKKTNPLQQELLKYLIQRCNMGKEQTSLRPNVTKQKNNLEQLTSPSDPQQILAKPLDNIETNNIKNSVRSPITSSRHLQINKANKSNPSTNKNHLELISLKNYKNFTLSTLQTQVSDQILLSQVQKHQHKLNLKHSEDLDNNSLKIKKNAYSFNVE